MERLTRKQRRLVKDLDEISRIVVHNYHDVLKMRREVRTDVLTVTIREIIRGEVITQYTLIDEYLAVEMCRYFFGSSDFPRLWKTRLFERFNYFVVEKLSLMEKLAVVRDIRKMPKSIREIIESVKALRNGLAHAFFPENLRAYRMKGHPVPRKTVAATYKGIDIFSAAGVQRFIDDVHKVYEFFRLRMQPPTKRTKDR